MNRMIIASSRIARFGVLFTGALLVLLLSNSRPVAAHNSYVDSSPAQGEVLSVAPTVWTVNFAKSVPLASASGEIVMSDGTRQRLGAPRHGATDSTIVFDLPAGVIGDVTARWRLVSVDGHVISGRVSFSVVTSSATTVTLPAQDPVASSTTLPMGSDGNDPVVAQGPPESLRAGIRLVSYLSLVLLGGLLFSELYLARGSLATGTGRRLVWMATVGSAVGPMLGLIVFVGDIREPDQPWLSALGAALSLTTGAMFLFRVVVGSLVCLLLCTPRFWRAMSERSLMKVGFLVVASCVALAFGGHSRSMRFPWLGIPADVLHVVSVGVWLGGLVVLLSVVVPNVGVEESIGAFKRFGRAAESAVLVIVITGLVQSFRLHPDPTGILGSTHGILLLVKVAIVGLMLCLAKLNRGRLESHRGRAVVASESTRALLVRTTVSEVLLGALVMVVTSILVGVSPG